MRCSHPTATATNILLITTSAGILLQAQKNKLLIHPLNYDKSTVLGFLHKHSHTHTRLLGENKVLLNEYDK